MSSPALLAILVLASIPPLSEGDRERIAVAYDGRRGRDAAFAAMVEHVSTWTPGPGDAPVRLEPDLEAMIVDPDRWRGELCRLEGVIQQQSTLGPPFENLGEWFLRDDEGRPFAVWVCGLDGLPAFSDGQRIEVYGRFLKYIDATARDRQPRRYAGFVGAFPKRVAIGVPEGWARLGVVAVPMALMLVVFVGLMVYIRRSRSSSPVRAVARPDDGLQLDEGPPLPDDPAGALAELRRRKDAQDAGHA